MSDCVLFLLDGACPHAAIQTTQTIEILREVHFEVLEHSVCSPFVLSLSSLKHPYEAISFPKTGM